MDTARILFEQFKAQGFALIQKTVEEEWQEDLSLDFKCLERNAAPMTDKDRQTLAEALSGFANSEGGIIVWGVHASQRAPDEPDVARTLKRIGKIKLFRSNLETNSPQIVSPAVMGVEHITIEDPNQTDGGFAVTYVPKGEGEPHMARAKDQHRYYYRSSSSFLKMESFMVSDRYGRRPQPKIELEFTIEREFIKGQPRVSGLLATIDIPGAARRPTRDTYEYQLIIKARNNGRGFTQYTNCFIGVPIEIVQKSAIKYRGADQLEEREGKVYFRYYKANTIRDVVGQQGMRSQYGPSRYEPILPGLSHRWTIDLKNNIDPAELESLQIRWKIFADNSPPVEGQIRAKEIEIIDTKQPDFTSEDYDDEDD